MDMDITDLKKGERAVVLKVECEGDLFDRLVALGVFSGAKITLLKRSFFGHGYLIEAANSRIAMEKEVAKKVRIWRI